MTRILKALVAATVLAAVGWSGWWWLAARGQEAALAGWLEARAAEGWQADAARIAITGFPRSFDRRVEGFALADPAAGWAWSGPLLTATSPAWDPTTIALALPSAQKFSVPGESTNVTSARFDVLMSVWPGTDLTLRSAGIDVAELLVVGRSGWGAGARDIDARIARRDASSGPPNGYDLEMSATDLVLPRDVVGRLDPTGQLGLEVGRLALAAQFITDRPLDRHVIENGELGAETVVVRAAELVWDDIALAVSGRLDADAAGFAQGSLRIEAREWRRLIALMERAGVVGPGAADAIEGALGLVALFGGGESIDVTLRFEDGRVRLGPVSIGDAPRLVDRG